MGAALTYARRYALFTLVGIAGDDDLDAPDLAAPSQPTSEPDLSNRDGKDLLNGRQHNHAQRTAIRGREGAHVHSTGAMLGPEASAQARDRLLAELSNLICGDDAALWAHRSLPLKNKLTAADAQRIEDAFQTKLASLESRSAELSRTPDYPEHRKILDSPHQNEPKQFRFKTIDKSTLALPEPRRVRDRDHVKFVAKQPCLICGRRPSDATICALPKAARSGARSVTSSLCHYAEVTIARSITVAMKLNGGTLPVLIRALKLVRCGWKRIRWHRLQWIRVTWLPRLLAKPREEVLSVRRKLPRTLKITNEPIILPDPQ